MRPWPTSSGSDGVVRVTPTRLRRAWGPRRSDDAAPAPASWQTDVLLVCQRCSAKLPDGLAPDGRTMLRQWFRERLGAVGLGKALRVVETSCLGLCPERRVAVAIGRELAGEPALIRSVATEADREAVYRAALGTGSGIEGGRGQPGPKL
jgi:hypothetical protein